MPILACATLEDLVTAALRANGLSQSNAAAVAKVIVAAEMDGAESHGLFRLPGYIATLKSGHVNGEAQPKLRDAALSLIHVDADNGFAQPALAMGRDVLIAKARHNGIAAMGLYNSHHFAALWPDVEPLAEAGLIALCFANSRPRIAPFDAKRRLIGTNPMAFACPRPDGPPLVWDQASSIMAQGQVLLAAKRGERLDKGVLIDRDGTPSDDPAALQAGGAIRAFGGHKGSGIALMVEILAGALTGAKFGFEDIASEQTGSATQNVGHLIIAIDPQAFGGDGFTARIGALLEHLAQGGVTRLPGEMRHARRKANDGRVEVSDDVLAQLHAWAGQGR